MIEGGCGVTFALEATKRLRIIGEVIREKLEGNEAVEASVLGLVDHAHTTAAELLDDAVVGNCAAEDR